MPAPSSLASRSLRTLAALLPLVASPIRAQVIPENETGTNVYALASVEGHDPIWLHEGGPRFHVTRQIGGLATTAAGSISGEGHLHAYASILAGGATYPYGNVSATVSYRDRISFVGTAPSRVEFDLFLHGTALGRSSGSLVMWYQSLGEFGTGPVAQYRAQLNADGSHWGGSDHEQRLVRRNVRGDVVDGVFTFELTLNVDATLRMPVCPDVSGPLEPPTECGTGGGLGASTMADFGDTAGIQAMRAYDADGNLITSGLLARSELGHTYALEGGSFAPTSTVPEPTTWSLLGAGVAILGVVARRRRAGAASTPAVSTPAVSTPAA
jgi:hypothetical protein